MLNTEAVNKECPLKYNRESDEQGLCTPDKCMGWTQDTKVVKGKDGHYIYQIIKPLKGHCGMIPPELECGCGG
jgi:hypothetical protein